MSKLTSVEWLVEQLWKHSEPSLTNKILIEQAKEMHKQEIIDAAERWKGTDFAERYYKETYQSGDVNDMIDVPQQNDVREDDVEKLAKEWIDKNSHKWSNNTDEVGDNYGSFVEGWNKCKKYYELVLSTRELHNYKLGLKDGFDKAKENTYTEEQVMEAMVLISDYYAENIFKKLDGYKKALEIIQSLKQYKQ